MRRLLLLSEIPKETKLYLHDVTISTTDDEGHSCGISMYFISKDKTPTTIDDYKTQAAYYRLWIKMVCIKYICMTWDDTTTGDNIILTAYGSEPYGTVSGIDDYTVTPVQNHIYYLSSFELLAFDDVVSEI